MSNLRCGGIGVGLPHILRAKIHADDLAAKLPGEENGALALACRHVENANSGAEAQQFSERAVSRRPPGWKVSPRSSRAKSLW